MSDCSRSRIVSAPLVCYSTARAQTHIRFSRTTTSRQTVRKGGRWRERRPAGIHINYVVCWSTETRNKREYQKEIECKSSEQTLTASRCLIRLLFDQVCEENRHQPYQVVHSAHSLHLSNTNSALSRHTLFFSAEAKFLSSFSHLIFSAPSAMWCDDVELETRDSANANPC